MKQIVVVVALVVSLLLSVTVFSVLLNPSFDPEPFYVGVTYCGESVEDAELLIDKVKAYTNLFVLQSGLLPLYPDMINEIGDYAVSSGMHFMVYFGSQAQMQLESWLETGQDRWDDKFLGVYFGDEPAGEMLDYHITETYDALGNSMNFGSGMFNTSAVNLRITKSPNSICVTYKNGTYISFMANGTIYVAYHDDYVLDYAPDGSVKKLMFPDYHSMSVNASDVPSREQILVFHPFPTYEDAADFFVDVYQGRLGYPKDNSLQTITSDYGLYWFDYKAGYDVVLAQVGWNHTIEQDIALVRGAATLQNKSWGVIITWKYNQFPYLDSGTEIYNQMCTAYKAGAQYVVIFNYAEDAEGPYATLQTEHFDALELFWNDVVQSSAVKHGSVKAEAVLVMPENFGWGMRNAEDTIWGIWNAPTEETQKIWEQSRVLLQQYDLSLDMVYDDPTFPVEGKYSQIYYWNQVG